MRSRRLVRIAPRHLVALLLAVLVAGAGIANGNPAAIPPAAAAAAPAASAAIRPPSPPANQTAPPAAPSAPLASVRSPSLPTPSPPSVRSNVTTSTQAAAASSTSKNAAALIATGPGPDDISDATLIHRYASTLLSPAHLPALAGCDGDAKRLCDAHLEAVRTYSYTVHSAVPPNMTVIELLQLANRFRYPGLDEFCAALPAHVPPTSQIGLLTAGADACRLACRQPGEFGGLTAHPLCRRTWVVFGVCATRPAYPEALSALQLATGAALKRVMELPLPAIANGAAATANLSDAALDTEYGGSLLSVDLWQPLAGCTANATRRLCAAHYEAVRAYRAHRPSPPPNMEVIQLLQEAIASTYSSVQAFCAAVSPALPLHADCATECADGASTRPMCHRILAIYEAAADNAAQAQAQALVIAIQRINEQAKLATVASAAAPAAAPVVAAPVPAKVPAEAQVAAKPAAAPAAPAPPAVKITEAPIETANANPLAADAADAAGTGEAAADGDQLPDDAKAPLDDAAAEMAAAAGMDGDERDEEDDDIDMAGELNGINADAKLAEPASAGAGGNGGREPIVQRDPFVDDEESSFFSYFMFVLLVCVAVYVLYHNRRLLVALLLEGRRRNGTSGVGRRKHTAAYRKLDTNLEEAISSSSTAAGDGGGGGRSTQPIIY